MVKKHCDCGCGAVYYKGLLFIDWATGYVTQAAECAGCGTVGQVPSMFNPEVLWRFPKHSECIEINI